MDTTSLPVMPTLTAEGAGHAGLRWFDLTDTQTGAIRRVFLWLPPGEMPEAGWPALFMTDGNAVIATAIDAMRAQAPYPSGTNLGQGALVAIGYPTDDAYDPFRRSWDLGPPPGATYPPFWPDTPEVKTGGGAEMARFILEDVRAFLGTLTRLDPAQQGLFGHSFGGLFALWLMFNRPDAFTHWVAASPSITWEGNFLMAHRDAFAPQGRTLRVLLSAGEWEGDELAPFQRGAEDADKRLAAKAEERTLDAGREMAEDLDRLPGVTAVYETYANETHMSVLPVAVNRALHWVFGRRS
ncbi:alpha/beta hydrolase [Paracoccus aestuariivivens]|uniref:Prolyl oligopeptidase family serine peptidase n=1 Tax=Paracoccus aestuariivivens TaxID=1820333 RepID=A0A6L6JF44_9RHOB|nr:alpha/beta hydrolase-fold protein [Paracoccus aestuariivivens]MTH79875.1 prolyl oligopeptidase family serine peptidase [Paracoccus aestuariivivens]